MAYRTFDAQYFGVAQRRKRIYLVADFGSERAGEVLFEREGVCRDYTPHFPAWKGTAGYFTDCAGTAVAFEPRAASRIGGHVWNEFTGAHRADAGDDKTAVVYDARGNGNGNIASTLTGDHENRVTDYTSLAAMPVIRKAVFVPYGICSRDSNAMKSSNPHSGIYEAGTSRTLDQSGGNPSCNQGGIAVCVQGSMIGREEKNGPQGDGVNEDVSFTLNTCDKHAVAYAMITGEFTQVCREQCPCLQARDYKDPPVISLPQYIVRRLTPTECARLQGFPDWWCDDLESPEPTEDEIKWWAEVFETHRRIMGTSTQPKSRKQIVKWLKNPYSDSAAYRMWGNGVALPCVCFAMAGVVSLTEENTR